MTFKLTFNLDYKTLTTSVPYVNKVSYNIYTKDIKIHDIIDKRFMEELNCKHLRQVLDSTITVFFRNVSNCLKLDD